MPVPADILPHGRPVRSQLTEATVVVAPGAFGDAMVVSPAWNPEVQWTIDRWPVSHGTTLPTVGAYCVIGLTDNGARFCLWWDGVYA